jgi:hypothetical protein
VPPVLAAVLPYAPGALRPAFRPRPRSGPAGTPHRRGSPRPRTAAPARGAPRPSAVPADGTGRRSAQTPGAPSTRVRRTTSRAGAACSAGRGPGRRCARRRTCPQRSGPLGGRSGGNRARPCAVRVTGRPGPPTAAPVGSGARTLPVKAESVPNVAEPRPPGTRRTAAHPPDHRHRKGCRLPSPLLTRGPKRTHRIGADMEKSDRESRIESGGQNIHPAYTQAHFI